MPDSVVRVDFTPAVITCDFEAMGASLDRLLEPYEGMTEADALALDRKTAKAARADLNAMKRELEDSRKAIKRAYSEPLTEFEEGVRELVGRIDRYAQVIDAAVKAKESAEREEKRRALEREYEEFCPFLACGENGPLVPFDAICDKKWLNRSTGFNKAVGEMQERASAIASDYEALRAQAGSLGHYQEDVAVFFRTLSLAEALENERRRTEEDARLRELQERQGAPEPRPEPEPGRDDGEPDVWWPEGAGAEPERPLAYTVSVSLTLAQVDELLGFFRERGIHGRIFRDKEVEQ